MSKKYVIDIDDTICIEKGPVISRIPYRDRIKQINELYDHLYFKPFDADIFIDDRAIHPDEFFKN